MKRPATELAATLLNVIVTQSETTKTNIQSSFKAKKDYYVTKKWGTILTFILTFK